MIDSRGLIHTPKIVRWIALFLLLTTLVVAIGVTVYFTFKDNAADPKYTDWILVGMSLVHLALSGLAVAAVLFYSEREVNTDTLQRKTENFLSASVPHALQRVTSSYALRHTVSRVERLGRSDIFGAAYEISSGEKLLRVWIGLNVSRLIVIYLVCIPEGIDGDDYCLKLEKIFGITFGGARKVGYETQFAHTKDDKGQAVVSIWTAVDTEHNLLVEPAQRLFWLQDVAMMTESFWRTSIRSDIVLSPTEPSPL
jgi:hypothetical protein